MVTNYNEQCHVLHIMVTHVSPQSCDQFFFGCSLVYISTLSKGERVGIPKCGE